MASQSSPGGFLLLGFSEHPGLERMLFVVVLTSYLLTLVGNTLIILLSMWDPRLHSPVYFFLSNLSFLELCFTTSSIPQTLVNLWGPKTTSFLGCSVHFFIFLFLGTTECILLTVMAFDRYVAICQPLCYTTIICPRLCRPSASMAWVISLLESVVHTPPTLRLPFCPHRQVDDCMRSQLSSDCPVGTPPPMRSRRLLPASSSWSCPSASSLSLSVPLPGQC